MTSRAKLFLLVFAVLMVAQAWAHHNMTAVFDFNDRVTVTGTLTAIDWRNPHTYFTVQVKGAGGAIESWQIEGPSPSFFRIRDVGKPDFERVTSRAPGSSEPLHWPTGKSSRRARKTVKPNRGARKWGFL